MINTDFKEINGIQLMMAGRLKRGRRKDKDMDRLYLLIVLPATYFGRLLKGILITTSSTGIFLITIFLTAGLAYCAELLPIEPPIRGYEQSPPKRFSIDSSVYLKFEEKIRGLNTQERESLKVTIKQKRDASASFEEYKYYQNLIDLLEKRPK